MAREISRLTPPVVPCYTGNLVNPTDDILSFDTITPDDLRRLAALLEKHDLTELRYEQGSTRLTLRTAAYFRERQTAGAVTMLAASAPVAPLDTSVQESELAEVIVPLAPGIRIEAPIMGVFYRTASPDDPPMVEVGDTVEAGQGIGLIEAMKVFSEVKSEVAGVVREIVAANKALVQPGDTLVILDAA